MKERFFHIVENSDINLFISEKEKRVLQDLKAEKKIRSKNDTKIRRDVRLKNTAEKLQDEINSYLMKASKPQNEFEEMLMEKLLKELGEVTTVRDLSEFLKMNRNCIYRAIDNGEIIHFRRGKKIFVVTEGDFLLLDKII